jgi:hypothetical protein
MPNFSDRTIDKFKTKLNGGGARSNLFEVSFGSQVSGTPQDAASESSVIFTNLGIQFEQD